MHIFHALSAYLCFPYVEPGVRGAAMDRLKKALWVPLIALMWIVVPASGAYILFGPSPVALDGDGSKAQVPDGATRSGSLGDLRERVVRAATRRYVASHPDAPAAMREGRALAPVDVLNADLAAHRAPFRVRKVQGAKARFYEVS
jgi:hypothetical protein